MLLEAELPKTLDVVIAGAVFSFLGYVGKLIYELLRKNSEERKKHFASLFEMCSLVNASFDVFVKQNELAKRLLANALTYSEIKEKSVQGYESNITLIYDVMKEADKELHTVIRGYSNALFELNTSMLNWLRKDFYFKTGDKSPEKKAMASEFHHLETHLYLWVAKYKAWIPNNPKHALVYLQDELHHGKGFPPALETSINSYLLKFHYTSFNFSKLERNTQKNTL